jgi:branched-chain amino acid:cation transporter, LIVCS family
MQQESVLIEKTNHIKQTITTGLALFSMFFGAGNLIFPLLIGKSVGAHAWYAITGLGLTAVIMPFLGLATMILFRGDYYKFFGKLGRLPGIALLAILLLILGPFGVIPRLVTLMHAILKPYLFDISLMPFSLGLVVVIFASCYKRQKLISVLGFLTPFLLICISILVFLGLVTPGSVTSLPSSKSQSFLDGLIGGYNTMDLIASFVFATVILPFFKAENAIENPKHRTAELLKKMSFPILIAASLLFFTYCGLCLIAASHAGTLDGSYTSEELLNAIAIKLLGPIGGFISAMAVCLACLTTAVTLTSIFADFLRRDLFKESINRHTGLLITSFITISFANLGFGGIAAFLTPVLQVVYPGIILLTVLNLFHMLYGWNHVKWPVFFAFTCSAIYYLN